MFFVKYNNFNNEIYLSNISYYLDKYSISIVKSINMNK